MGIIRAREHSYKRKTSNDNPLSITTKQIHYLPYKYQDKDIFEAHVLNSQRIILIYNILYHLLINFSENSHM